jgi:hypothetical protein
VITSFPTRNNKITKELGISEKEKGKKRGEKQTGQKHNIKISRSA